ncbi:MAG: hypothetical protein P9L91_05480 [Candidatus Zophobacter franzmannii]|nr:hypothetical protein [Candidatus Zophobacter franzmannii]
MKKLMILVGLVLLVLLSGCAKKEDVYFYDENIETIYYAEGPSTLQYPDEDVCIYMIVYDTDMDQPQTTLKKLGRKKRDFHPGKRVNLYFFANALPNQEIYKELGEKSKLTNMDMKHFLNLIENEDRYKLALLISSKGKEDFIINR